MPLRGKQADEGVLLDLLKLRIDSGDNKLRVTLKSAVEMQFILRQEYKTN
nr:unnamed protein product [Callosobruchus analis]